MTAAGWALQKAIYETLLSDAALKTLIGDPPRVHDGAPRGGVYPYVVFGDAREAPLAGVDGLVEHDIRLAIHSRHDGRREVKDVEAAIRAALDGAALAPDGCRLVSLRVTTAEIFRRPDSDAHQGVLRLRAVTEAL